MKQRGFTLVEMLVVIAIAAIIIAITLGIARGAIKMVRSFQGIDRSRAGAIRVIFLARHAFISLGRSWLWFRVIAMLRRLDRTFAVVPRILTGTPSTGFVGRDWFTYQVVQTDPNTGQQIPGGFVSAIIDVVPMYVSLSIGNYWADDPMTEVPYYNPPVTGRVPSSTMNLTFPTHSLPTGSTVTLSAADNTDIEVWDGDPNDPNSTILIDSDNVSYTWTVGDDPVPTQV